MSIVIFHMSPFPRYLLSKCRWPWPWPLEWTKVKCKYAKESPRMTCYLTSVVSPYLSPFPGYSLSKYVWPWSWPLEWVKVKCKYNCKYPTYDFPIIVNSNLYQLCHRLRWTVYIWTVKLSPTSKLDLEMKGQGHEKKRRPLHLGCQLDSTTIRWQRAVYLKTFLCGPPMICTVAHFIGSHVKDREIFIYFFFENIHKGHKLGMLK